MSGDALRIWLLSDGLPGHYNQARAIVAALAAERPVDVQWIDLKLRLGLARRLLRVLLNRTRRPLSIAALNGFYRVALPDGRPDLIVSAGGRTSFANAWLARAFGVPNFFAGSLRGLASRHFAAVLTLEPLPGVANNIVLEVPLSPVDPDTLDRLPVPETWRRPCWAMLVGGDGAGYRYGESDWRRLIEGMEALATRHGVRWLLAGSRRTGPLLPRLLDGQACDWIEDRDVGGGPDSRLPGYLAAATRVFVTEDSMSMLSDAIASGRPVVALRPAHAQPDARFGAALRRFEADGLIVRRTIADLARLTSAPAAAPAGRAAGRAALTKELLHYLPACRR